MHIQQLNMKLNILISGGTGLAGSYLLPFLTEKGHTITVLTTGKPRTSDNKNITYSHWHPEKAILDQSLFETHNVVINMAGASVGERWTESHRKSILDSRVAGTALLADAINQKNSAVKLFVSFSATGIYPSNGLPATEESQLADESDFLASVCQSWEKASEITNPKVRKVILRLGIIFSPRGGMLGKLLPLFRWGLGASLGNGQQLISWIHPEDLCRIIEHILENREVSGIINATAPKPISMKKFSELLAKQLRRPLILPPVFAWQLKLIGGEGALEALKSFYVTSKTLEGAGFVFKYETAEEALKELIGTK